MSIENKFDALKTEEESEVIILEVASDADTSDEENAEYVHRLFDKIPDDVRIKVRRRKSKGKKCLDNLDHGHHCGEHDDSCRIQNPCQLEHDHICE